MPLWTQHATRNTQHEIKNKLKLALHVTCYLLLVTLLTACSAIGTRQFAALQVTSTPEASVFLDGKHLGKTPFASDQLEAREYLVKLSSGEASHVENVTLRQGTLTVINRELHNNFLAQSGEVLWLEKGASGLFISSMPDGADIAIDGSHLGRTPLLINDIEEGDHQVTLTKQGYLDHEFAIKTSPNFRLVAQVTLASQIAKGVNPPTPPQDTPEVKKVEVSKTPQGFLRVRAEPSLEAPEIGRVQTGDELEVIQETAEWLKIIFDGKQGWVSGQYVKNL